MKKLLAIMLVVSFLVVPSQTYTDVQVSQTYLMAHIKKETVKIIDYRQQQITCLAKNIFYEASNESSEGKLAVGLVTMNRANSKRFPNSVCGVVHQKHKSTCQFSWVCGTKLKLNRNQFNESLKIAAKVYDNYHKINDITHGALYFHYAGMYPNWANPNHYTTTIGKHVFYKF